MITLSLRSRWCRKIQETRRAHARRNPHPHHRSIMTPPLASCFRQAMVLRVICNFVPSGSFGGDEGFIVNTWNVGSVFPLFIQVPSPSWKRPLALPAWQRSTSQRPLQRSIAPPTGAEAERDSAVESLERITLPKLQRPQADAQHQARHVCRRCVTAGGPARSCADIDAAHFMTIFPTFLEARPSRPRCWSRLCGLDVRAGRILRSRAIQA